MDLATIANVATALTLIAGVGFGLVEAQRSRRARQERATFAAVQAILTPEWMKSMVVVHNIPDGSSASDIEADRRVLDATHAVGVILEGLGYSVYAQLVPLQVVGDLLGAPFVLLGVDCGPMSKRNAAAAVHRKRLNGSNGSPCNWSDIPQEKPACRSARRKRIATGNRVDPRGARTGICVLGLNRLHDFHGV
jgi:hypothetical protein